MDTIYNIKLSFEQKVKDSLIEILSNKQGGAYNVFSYHWACFAWAAIIGFQNEKREPLKSPLADKPFSLTTMRNNGGEKIANALICMCVAKADSLNILKDPNQVITMINEYANGGFYYVQQLIDNGQNSFIDFEKVKQEIFSRDIDI